jgi:adenylate cyclase
MKWQQKIAQINQTLPPKRQMMFRASINCGDVLISSTGTLYGEAVNIAARIQRLAPPGGVLVSSAVREQLQGLEKLTFDYFGSEELKNISREIQVYGVQARAEI